MFETVATVGLAVAAGTSVLLLFSIARTLVRLVWLPEPGDSSTLVRTPSGYLRRCSACDTVNGPRYRYCQQCTSSL